MPLPFLIVTDLAAGRKTTQPQTHLQWGRISITKIDTPAKALLTCGGLIPITAAGYQALLDAGCTEA